MSKYLVTIRGTEVDLRETVKGLITAAGLAASVQSADLNRAAESLARSYHTVPVREIETEIARILRNGG